MGRWCLWVTLGGLLAATFALSSAAPAQAIQRLPLCANNIDDDGDRLTDFPAEPGCTNANDPAEADPSSAAECSDGRDNEPDNKIDYPLDPGCVSAADPTENDPTMLPACADANDNDGDGRNNYRDDPGCIAASDPREQNVACSDGVDNDGDLRIDFPLDFGCGVPSSAPDVIDNSEVDPPACNDGRDNDGDIKLDTDTNIAGQAADPGCSSPTDDDETDPPPPLCADTIDNDLDGRIDFPNDPGCASPLDGDEGNPAPPIGPTAQVYPPIAPFPVVRLRGRTDRRGVSITLLRVQAPNGSRVTIYCSGRGCPTRRASTLTRRGYVRARRFERRLRAGTTLRIYVTKAGFTGKYTRFKIRRRKSPMRTDRCARSAGAKPVACPIN